MRAVQVTRGLELELAGSASTWVFSIVNNGFLLIYMCEIFLRFMGRGLSAIRDALTCLDIALVLLTFVERMAAGASMARSLPSIRLLRLLRLIRAFKRMHKSKEPLRHERERSYSVKPVLRLLCQCLRVRLVVLLSGTSKAARTLAWVSLFLMVIAWAAGACTRQVIGNSPVWNGSTNPMVNFEPFMSFDNREYFGNIVRSFLSMIQVITNAQWANHIGRPIILQYPALFVFFAFFLLSTTFGLVTCIVANIVQDTVLRWVQDSLESSRAFEKALKEIDRENRCSAPRRSTSAERKPGHQGRSSGLRAGKLLMMVDEDGDGQLTQSDLDRALENEEFVQILRLLEVPVMSSENLMRLFDLSGRALPALRSFGFARWDAVTGIEGPESLEVHDFKYDIDPKDYTKLALWSDSLMKRMEACEQRCHVLAQQVVDLRRQMKECFNCLALFIGSRMRYQMHCLWRIWAKAEENTELYYRALKAIRSAPPPMPVDIREALGLEIKEEKVLEDEAAALMNFARRYVAAGPPTGCRDVTRATVT
ncbi:unnamed protein product [Durusdinium trenchii]|uniref:Ion transport domain-containing protein n=1 Tax=Durusdinium trenchii TaxID=1381693 RepID=A0ABP0HVH1_9DINO